MQVSMSTTTTSSTLYFTPYKSSVNACDVDVVFHCCTTRALDCSLVDVGRTMTMMKDKKRIMMVLEGGG